MEMPVISIILPTYNRAEMLRGALETLVRQETRGEFSYEIVVVDNASTDATKTVVEGIAGESPVPVRYFRQEAPGDAPTRNCGLSKARGDWLAFIDDDELATPDWLRKLYDAARETGAPIVGGAVHLDLPQDVLDRLTRFVRCTSLREIDYYPNIHLYTGKRLPGTCNALVRKAVFTDLGIFDVSRKCGESDSEFFLRAKTAGMDLYYTPHAVVRHRVASNRLTKEYFRWDAQQGCIAHAGLDYKYKGRTRLVFLCTARIAQALLVILPRLAWGYLRKDAREILGQQVRLWRTEGYVRRTLAILAPAWFPQRRYFDSLEFHKGRIIGQQKTPTEVTS